MRSRQGQFRERLAAFGKAASLSSFDEMLRASYLEGIAGVTPGTYLRARNMGEVAEMARSAIPATKVDPASKLYDPGDTGTFHRLREKFQAAVRRLPAFRGVRKVEDIDDFSWSGLFLGTKALPYQVGAIAANPSPKHVANITATFLARNPQRVSKQINRERRRFQLHAPSIAPKSLESQKDDQKSLREKLQDTATTSFFFETLRNNRKFWREVLGQYEPILRRKVREPWASRYVEFLRAVYIDQRDIKSVKNEIQERDGLSESLISRKLGKKALFELFSSPSFRKIVMNALGRAPDLQEEVFRTVTR